MIKISTKIETERRRMLEVKMTMKMRNHHLMVMKKVRRKRELILKYYKNPKKTYHLLRNSSNMMTKMMKI